MEDTVESSWLLRASASAFAPSCIATLLRGVALTRGSLLVVVVCNVMHIELTTLLPGWVLLWRPEPRPAGLQSLFWLSLRLDFSLVEFF
jgi:hypothetical protein